MRRDISITDTQVKLAEELLLPSGKKFDDQRVDFIRNLQTLDLHAVPGSGKTTALLAKLVCLEQHLPFIDRSGILVISHTNSAVNEIRNKIGHHCPRLFSYPNFIGTIQAFTDAFLTIPYYKSKYRKRPVRIDNELYLESHYPDPKFRIWLSNRNNGNSILYDYRLRDADGLTYKAETTPFPFGVKSTSFRKVLTIKKDIREKGFLCFDDAYILAEEYLSKYPRIVEILQKRFRYVFVDEMQDMDKHQYDLLERLFGNINGPVYQRIGDKNQAIYNDEAKMAAIWQERNVKEINGSHRLSPEVASIVKRLALEPINIVGLAENPAIILPKLIVFSDTTISSVIPTFARQVRKLVDEGVIDIKRNNGFKAVAWTTGCVEETDEAIRLKQYFPSFSKEHSKLQINYACLESYLNFYEKGANRLSSLRKSILNGLLRVLRLESIYNPDTGRAFTKRTFLEHLKIQHPIVEQKFKLTLYKISKLAAEGKKEEALKLFTGLVKATLNRLEAKITESYGFVHQRHPIEGVLNATVFEAPRNRFTLDGVEIDIATVHSVKGQTHTCTLYLESFYEKNRDGKGQYESTRIAEQLQDIQLLATAHSFVKQTLKMAYVGFSRPTHLLCFAIHKKHFDLFYSGKPNGDLWDIVVV